jgi:hypothetical protein
MMWEAPAARCSSMRARIFVSLPQATALSTRRSLPPSAKSDSENPHDCHCRW